MLAEDRKKTELYCFHILLEAKARAIVVQCKKHHPEWSKQEIKDVLSKLVDLSYEKDELKDE